MGRFGIRRGGLDFQGLVGVVLSSLCCLVRPARYPHGTVHTLFVVLDRFGDVACLVWLGSWWVWKCCGLFCCGPFWYSFIRSILTLIFLDILWKFLSLL